MLHPAGFPVAANNDIKVTKNRSLSSYSHCSYFTYINVTTVFHGELFLPVKVYSWEGKFSSFSDSVLALLSCLQLMLFVSVEITAFIVGFWLRAVIEYYPRQFLILLQYFNCYLNLHKNKKKDIKESVNILQLISVLLHSSAIILKKETLL